MNSTGTKKMTEGDEGFEPLLVPEGSRLYLYCGSVSLLSCAECRHAASVFVRRPRYQPFCATKIQTSCAIFLRRGEKMWKNWKKLKKAKKMM